MKNVNLFKNVRHITADKKLVVSRVSVYGEFAHYAMSLDTRDASFDICCSNNAVDIYREFEALNTALVNEVREYLAVAMEIFSEDSDHCAITELAKANNVYITSKRVDTFRICGNLELSLRKETLMGECIGYSILFGVRGENRATVIDSVTSFNDAIKAYVVLKRGLNTAIDDIIASFKGGHDVPVIDRVIRRNPVGIKF